MRCCKISPFESQYIDYRHIHCARCGIIIWDSFLLWSGKPFCEICFDREITNIWGKRKEHKEEGQT